MSIARDNDQPDREPRAWVVRAGREGETEQHNLDHSVVTIGWDDWGEELDSCADRDAFGEHLKERFSDLDENGWRSGRDQIWRFGKEIEVGDLVVMPQKRPGLGQQRLIAIGRVVGPYEFDSSQPKNTWQRRKVDWLKRDLPREVPQNDLLYSIDASGTVFGLKKNDAAYRIQYLAKHGNDPGPRNPGGGQSEMWDRRLEEYLDHLRTLGRANSTVNNKRSILGRWTRHMLEQGESPVLFDPIVLNGFLDGAKLFGKGSRRHYSSHIKLWCENWDVSDRRSPRSTDTRPLRERLESAAEKLLCDVGILQEIIDLLADKGQVILYGQPGTGKTYLAQELAEALAPDEGTRSLVQFHPAYSYEDFFEGYRPVIDDDKQMTYELIPGPLANLAEHAAEYPEQQHVMVIDEINRANLPRVLGELLFLLEYRDKSIAVMHRPDGNFNLPKNLWFIGTMNTADRSIALIDAAMRRRFHFVPFFPEREPTKSLLRKWTNKTAPGQAWVVDIVSAVNSELKKELGGEHLQLGPSHFMKTDLNEGGFKRVWEYNIEPFIEDQLFGNPDKIKKFRLDAVLLRYGPEHFEGSGLLDGPAIPEDELPSSSGQASSGG